MKLIIKYIPYQWSELPLKQWYKIFSTIKNLLGNTGKGDWRNIRFKIVL